MKTQFVLVLLIASLLLSAKGFSIGEEFNAPLYKRYGYTDSLEFLRDQVALQAYPYTGIEYKHAGETMNGFDCSGFIRFMYAFFNVDLPHNAQAMSSFGKPVSWEESTKGDLVFFGSKTHSGVQVTHVGMVFSKEDGEIEMVHASLSQGIKVDRSDASVWKNYWGNKYLFMRRIIG